jgi:hypothetical protein
MNVGRIAKNFSALEGDQAEDYMAVSCGPSGYVPSDEEWESHRNYFTPP